MIYVINLKRATERRAHMEAQLEALGLPYTFAEAVDGRSLDPEAVEGYDLIVPLYFCQSVYGIRVIAEYAISKLWRVEVNIL